MSETALPSSSCGFVSLLIALSVIKRQSIVAPEHFVIFVSITVLRLAVQLNSSRWFFLNTYVKQHILTGED
jgi:hypothetical protein